MASVRDGSAATGLLARDGGSVRTLGTPPEILLGAASTRPRTGLARLAGLLADGPGRTVEDVRDLLLEQIVGTRPDDDVALVVVRLR